MARKEPPRVTRDKPYDTNTNAGYYDTQACIARDMQATKYGFTALVLYGHSADTKAAAIKVPTMGLIALLRTARILAASDWTPGQIAGQIISQSRYAEVLPLPSPDVFFGRCGGYAEDQGCEWGFLIWNLADNTCECWGPGALSTFDCEGIDVFISTETEPRHGEW